MMARFALRGWWAPLLALSLALLPFAPTVSAQTGGASVSVDRGPGSTYNVGDPIVISYQIPQPGFVRLTAQTPAGGRTIFEGTTGQTSGTVRTVVGEPAGQRTLRVELFVNNQLIAYGETNFYAGPGTGGNPSGGGGAIGCNTTVNGQLANANDQHRWTFSASAGTRVSIANVAPQIAIYPPPPNVQLSLVAPNGATLTTGTGSLPDIVLPVDGQYTIVVGGGGQFGAQVQINYQLRLTCTGGGGTPPPPPASSVNYSVGWNLVGGPTGATFPVPLFQFDPASNSYRTVAANTGVQAGQGYWAYFTQPTTVSLSGIGQGTASVNVAGLQWVQVANPSATGNAQVLGADVVYVWDPVANQYSGGNLLRPGQGAWALRNTAGAITIQAQ